MPSGPRNNISPPISCMVSSWIHPISNVIGCKLKSDSDEPTNLRILLSVKIINCSRKTISPVITPPTLIVPAPDAAVKSVSSKSVV